MKVEQADGSYDAMEYGKGQVNTLARAAALADPRLALKMAITLVAVAANTPHEYVFNNDGSTIISAPDGTGAQMVRIVNSKDSKEVNGAMQSTAYQGGLCCIQKVELLISAAGHYGRVCIVIQVLLVSFSIKTLYAVQSTITFLFFRC